MQAMIHISTAISGFFLLTDMGSKYMYNKCNPFLLIEGVSQVKHDCRANFAARYPTELA